MGQEAVKPPVWGIAKITFLVSDNTLGLPPGKKKSPRYISRKERMGPVVKERRKEIILSTKVTSRDPDEAMRQVETSLKRLQTDHLDQLMIHDVRTIDNVDKVSGKGNLIDILHRLKEQGLTRFIRFSGHTDAVAMKEIDFDTMLIAMNHWNEAKMKEMAIQLTPFFNHENLPWMQPGYRDGKV